MVAEQTQVNQAIADLSRYAAAFLQRVHQDHVGDVRATAELHLHRLREFSRRNGIALDELPAYDANITTWRAVARLASAAVETGSRAG